jgi:hypothetical protein
MIEYHDPEGQVGVDTTPYTLSTPVRDATGINIALLANGFPDSEKFLAELATVLQEEAPGITALPYNKSNASVPAGKPLLNEISKECSAAISAYGH